MFIQYQKQQKLIYRSSVTECYASHENFSLAEVTLTQGMLGMDFTLGKKFLFYKF